MRLFRFETNRHTAPLLAATIVLLTADASSQNALQQPSLAFRAPRFLPGDVADGMTAGQQQETELAAGNGGFLAVWSDGRSCPSTSPWQTTWSAVTGSPSRRARSMARSTCAIVAS